MKRVYLSMIPLFCIAMFTAGCAAGGGGAAAQSTADPVLTTPVDGTRRWLGPRYWGNRLQDWQQSDGRIECVASRPWLGMRTVHDLTRQVTDSSAELNIHIRIDRLGNANRPLASDAAGGILIGAGRGEMDYRAAALIHQWSGYGAGLFAGLDTNGQCFVVDNEAAWTLEAPEESSTWTSADLEIAASPAGNGRVTISITATDPATGEVISAAAKVVDADRLLGNVALVSHPGTQAEGRTSGLFGFTDWTITGDGVTEDSHHALGPIVSTQYTLSRGVMKMSAQLMPLGEDDADTAYFQVRRGNLWVTLASESIEVPSYSAVFRIADWDDTQDTPYRVTYTMNVDGNERATYHWSGTVRRDPVDRPQIVVAGFTGSLQMPWGRRSNWPNEMFFPHGDLTSRVAQHNPDLLFFSGDQLYEGTPTAVDRQNLHTDYLYKWMLHCWAYRDLTRDIPTVTIPDDHDVYQGNVWGEGGRQAQGRDNTGGYVHPAAFVNQVHRTQTAHLPDAYDPTLIDQDISVYYTDLVWGRVSFAILADRMFKSGCAGHGLPESGTGRPDHYNNTEFDTADLDLPGLKLLGDRQLDFLNHWAGDWRGSDMKMCLSQTVFANMATHHGGGRNYVIADLDSNGWPQTGRDNALAALRRGFAFHLAGDQHLGTLVHHGIDEHEDAGWSFCVPSVANAYPRAWAPQCPGPYVYPQLDEYLGDRLDGFKNKVTVYAASNPGLDMGTDRPILHNQMPGYGIVIVDKEARTYEAQCWPRSADPSDETQQYEGWPRTIDQQDNFAPQALGHLPTINVSGLDNPVISVIHQGTGEVVYTLRISGNSFTPPVYAEGKYTVVVSEPDTQQRKALRGLEIAEDGAVVDVSF